MHTGYTDRARWNLQVCKSHAAVVVSYARMWTGLCEDQ